MSGATIPSDTTTFEGVILPLAGGALLGIAVVGLGGKALLALLAAVAGALMLVNPAWSLYALVATIPMSIDFGDGLTVTRLIAPLALVLMIANALVRRSPWPNPLREPEGVLATVFFGAVFLSVPHAANSAKALGDLGSAALWIALFYATTTFVRSPRDIERLIWVLLAVAVAEALLTLAQVQFRFVLPGNWRPAALEGIEETTAGFRAEGTASHPILLAGFLQTVLPFAILLLWRARRAAAKLALLLAVGVVFVAWGATYARSSMIAMAAMLLAGLAISSRASLLLACAGFASGIGFLALHQFSIPDAIRTVNEIGTLGDAFRHADLFDSVASFRFRIESWAGGWNLFLAHPFFGVGLGQAIDLYMAYLPRWATSPVHPTEIHNVFVEAAAELGALGLLSLAGLWVYAFVSVLRAWHDPVVGGFARATFVALVGLFVFLTFTPMVREIWLILPLAGAIGHIARKCARQGGPA